MHQQATLPCGAVAPSERRHGPGEEAARRQARAGGRRRGTRAAPSELGEVASAPGGRP